MKKGFTLIELLVVIAIIGILSAIGLVSLNGAREKARNAQVRSDLSQMKTALALYADDHEGAFPAQVGAFSATCANADSTNQAGVGVFNDPDLIVGDYISQNVEPPTTTNPYFYCTNGTLSGAATDYVFYAMLEQAGTDDTYYELFFDGTVEDVADARTTVPVCVADGACTPVAP